MVIALSGLDNSLFEILHVLYWKLLNKNNILQYRQILSKNEQYFPLCLITARLTKEKDAI